MAIQNFLSERYDDRTVNVMDIPDVLELRPWFIRWIPGLRYKRHRQFLCWRPKGKDEVYVSPEFLRVVCGRQNIRKIQGDMMWDGIPELEITNKGGGAKGTDKVQMTDEQKARLERMRKKRGLS